MGLALLGNEERSKIRQKCVKIASKMRQNCAEHLWGEHLLDDTDETVLSKQYFPFPQDRGKFKAKFVAARQFVNPPQGTLTVCGNGGALKERRRRRAEKRSSKMRKWTARFSQ